jgi:Beta-ketoacyl synthase, N-terminal domain
VKAPSKSPSLAILGYGFFCPRAESPEHLLRGELRDAVAPPFAWVMGRDRRYTSLVTQLHLESIGQAAPTQRGAVRSIFGSVYGEIETAATFMADMGRGDPIRPAQFTQSVHNAPAGVFSIAARNPAASTTITAGPHTFAVALQEAELQLWESEEPILISLADEAVPSVFGSADPGLSLACAFVVQRAAAPLPVGNLALATIELSFRIGGTPKPGSAAASTGALAGALLGAVELCAMLERGGATEATIACSHDDVAAYEIEVLGFPPLSRTMREA